MIYPESKIEHVISTIWLEGREFDPFSSKLNMKTLRKMDQIRAKMRSNIGAVNVESYTEYFVI